MADLKGQLRITGSVKHGQSKSNSQEQLVNTGFPAIQNKLSRIFLLFAA